MRSSAGREVAPCRATYHRRAAADPARRQAYFNVRRRERLEANQRPSNPISRQLAQANKRFEVGLIAITGRAGTKAALDTGAAAVIAAKRNPATSEDQLINSPAEVRDRLSQARRGQPLKTRTGRLEAVVTSPWEQNLRSSPSACGSEIARDTGASRRGICRPSTWRGRSLQRPRVSTRLRGERLSLRQLFQTHRRSPALTGAALQLRLPIARCVRPSTVDRQPRNRSSDSRATERQARDAIFRRDQRSRGCRRCAMRSSRPDGAKATEAGYEVLSPAPAFDVLNSRKTLVQAKTTTPQFATITILRAATAPFAGNLEPARNYLISELPDVDAPTSRRDARNLRPPSRLPTAAGRQSLNPYAPFAAVRSSPSRSQRTAVTCPT